MLMLLFCVGQDRYALEARRVVEVVPVPPLHSMPGAPGHFAGCFLYEGHITPVIDLCFYFEGRSCQSRLSTRIIVVQRNVPLQPARRVGLMAERVTDTVRKTSVNSTSAAMMGAQVPYLGDIIRDEQGVIYCLEMDHFVSDSTGMLPPAEEP